MLNKIIAATAMSLMLTGGAFAQQGGEPPTDFEIGDRAVFVNEDNSMRDEADARTRFSAMAADRQQAIRDRCLEFRDSIRPGSADLTDAQRNPTDPVPGVFNMTTACDWVDRF